MDASVYLRPVKPVTGKLVSLDTCILAVSYMYYEHSEDRGFGGWPP
jgi:hypothetical protein